MAPANRISPEEFFTTLREQSIGPFIGVPCSLIKSLIAYAADHPSAVELVNPAHESHALAIAAGAHLGDPEGRLPMVFLQNSGFGNIVNPLTSLHQIYEIPALLLVTWRSEEGYGTDAPEHWIVGRDMEAYFSAFHLPYRILSPETWRRDLAAMKDEAVASRKPAVLCARKGLFESYQTRSLPGASYPMSSQEAVSTVKETLRGAVFLSTTGMISRESAHAVLSPDFYMMGSMGLISAIAEGCSRHTRDLVVTFDGDGALMMHMGLLPYIASRQPRNFLHVVIDNESYSSTGSQPTVSPRVDFAAMALACGYRHGLAVEGRSELAVALADIPALDGPILLAIKVRSGNDHGIARVSDHYTCPEVADRFRQRLLATAGGRPYHMPTRWRFAPGSLDALPSLDGVRAARSIALFTGRKSLAASGVLDRVRALLAGKEIHLFSTGSEPGLEDLQAVVPRLAASAAELVLAIGGGSVIDLAKAAAFCVRQDAGPAEVLEALPAEPRDALPLVAVPTTAGSGSEVTPFAVVWDKKQKKKRSLFHPSLFPVEALVDPDLTLSLPPDVTAESGIDAFVQACEAYFNRNHNPVSDHHALRAVSTLTEALPAVVQNPGDRAARHRVMRGSLEAGLAFSNTRTAACHSLSYPMTLHFGVPHGQAVALTLAEILPLNAEALAEGAAGDSPAEARRRNQAFCAALGAETIPRAAETIRQLLRDCGLATRLSEVGIGAADLDLLAAEGIAPERMGNNPHPLTGDSLQQLLLRCL